MNWLPIISAAAIAAVIGLWLGLRIGRQQVPQPAAEPAPPAEEPVENGIAYDETLLRLVPELPGFAVLVDSAGKVLAGSSVSGISGLVRRGQLTSPRLVSIIYDVLRTGNATSVELSLRPQLSKLPNRDLRVHTIPVAKFTALVLIDDETQANRVTATRRDFVANVSHELKTPVGGMSLLAEAILAADDPADVRQFAYQLRSEAERLNQLISDVINLSRVQGDDPLSQPEHINIADVIGEVVGTIEGSAQAKDITIVTSELHDAVVLGSRGQLSTALSNLLINAVAYSEPQTHIAVAMRSADGFVEIMVKDQGIGIPEGELERVFERFYRVDEARSRVTGGTGLGLAIVRNVCRNHGGEVFAWSISGEGSTFTMQLPAASAVVADITDSKTAEPHTWNWDVKDPSTPAHVQENA